MKIRLDPSAREPLSDQLRSALETRIASGGLAPGERMPTVRELAAELEIAPNTVAKAYRDLASAGMIIGRGRRGTFVSEWVSAASGDGDARLAEAAGSYARRAKQLGFGPSAARAAVDAALRHRRK